MTFVNKPLAAMRGKMTVMQHKTDRKIANASTFKMKRIRNRRAYDEAKQFNHEHGIKVRPSPPFDKDARRQINAGTRKRITLPKLNLPE